MKSVTFELETVTPLFLAGAEPRGAAELRAPAFRGAMRYWLRAIAGDAGDVYKELEAEVFGDTRNAGLVATRLSGSVESILFTPKGNERPMTPCGHDYLYWSMKGYGQDKPHQYIAERSRLRLRLSTRGAEEKADTALKQACVSLWLLLQLGGIGSRSRRTAGSLRYASGGISNPFAAYGLPMQAKSTVDLRKELATGISGAWSIMGSSKQTVTVPSIFDVIQPDACRIWVITGKDGGWRTSLEAINGIGAAMRDYRSRREPDHQNVAPWLEGPKPAGMTTIERAVFGLPLPFRYSSGAKGVVQGRREEYERRASPLWLHVSRLSDNEYVGVATLFKSQFLPPGEQLHADHKTINPPVDYRMIEDFISTKFNCQEVTL